MCISVGVMTLASMVYIQISVPQAKDEKTAIALLRLRLRFGLRFIVIILHEVVRSNDKVVGMSWAKLNAARWQFQREGLDG